MPLGSKRFALFVRVKSGGGLIEPGIPHALRINPFVEERQRLSTFDSEQCAYLCGVLVLKGFNSRLPLV